ncbi:hypothetical protein J2S49_000293 [Arcanobacterium wilhelmae]|uniref:Uncharacterized protein n=1 Tax=Arcanobacterium wilhelmae TaxID=1803177 RepID=A0ABT9N929_9ACTO|nr:hypothetical protein [Arcanobacterium wilhelmae]MDP9800217.1 hypothetical protein [Arcanobacterium wilhelmae]WFN89656.1 hypothetical protein P8A24_05465 [Arcanobacterium wilhelmae]
MFGRSQYPHYLRNEAGKRPTSAAELADGRWLATWPESLAIVSADGAREEYDWAEFEYGRWDEETSELSLALTRRGRGEPIVLVLADGSDPSVVTMVHERIERSIVHQLVWDLPSGRVARGQVRRRRNEELFTEILSVPAHTEADRASLAQLEVELREAVGLPLKKNS